jgi:hypothetical protein
MRSPNWDARPPRPNGSNWPSASCPPTHGVPPTWYDAPLGWPPARGQAHRDPALGELGIAVQTFLLVADDPETGVRSVALIGPTGHIQQRVDAYRAVEVSCLIGKPLARRMPSGSKHVARLKELAAMPFAVDVSVPAVRRV